MKKMTMQELREYVALHRDSTIHKMEQYPKDKKYYKGMIRAFDLVIDTVVVNSLVDETLNNEE